MWARFGQIVCQAAPHRRSAGLVAHGLDRLVLPADDDLRLSDIDEKMDNGALVTGAFRKSGSRRYSYIIE